MSSVPTTPSTLPPGHSPLPPLIANTHETGHVALAMSNSFGGPNASVDNFVGAFLATLPENRADDDVNFLGDAGAADDGDFATPTARPLFEVQTHSGLSTAKAAAKKLTCRGGPFSPL